MYLKLKRSNKLVDDKQKNRLIYFVLGLIAVYANAFASAPGQVSGFKKGSNLQVAGLPQAAVKLTAENNPDCVEYFTYHGASYCTTGATQIASINIQWPEDEPFHINFDNRAWKMAWGKKEKHITTIEYTPKGESITNWHELITSQFMPIKNPKVTAQFYVESIKKRLLGMGLKPHFQTLFESPNEVIFEFRIDNPSNMRQDEIQKVVRKDDGIYILHYVIKVPDMGKKMRAEWLRRLKASYPKK